MGERGEERARRWSLAGREEPCRPGSLSSLSLILLICIWGKKHTIGWPRPCPSHTWRNSAFMGLLWARALLPAGKTPGSWQLGHGHVTQAGVSGPQVPDREGRNGGRNTHLRKPDLQSWDRNFTSKAPGINALSRPNSDMALPVYQGSQRLRRLTQLSLSTTL